MNNNSNSSPGAPRRKSGKTNDTHTDFQNVEGYKVLELKLKQTLCLVGFCVATLNTMSKSNLEGKEIGLRVPSQREAVVGT